jgi:hypothetical protein
MNLNSAGFFCFVLLYFFVFNLLFHQNVKILWNYFASLFPELKKLAVAIPLTRIASMV